MGCCLVKGRCFGYAYSCHRSVQQQCHIPLCPVLSHSRKVMSTAITDQRNTSATFFVCPILSHSVEL